MYCMYCYTCIVKGASMFLIVMFKKIFIGFIGFIGFYFSSKKKNNFFFESYLFKKLNRGQKFSIESHMPMRKI